MPQQRIDAPVEALRIQGVDPRGLGRIRIRVPGTFDAGWHNWVYPMWPGSGGTDGTGSRMAPPPVGAKVIVWFIRGDCMSPSARAVYLGHMYGEDSEGVDAGPTLAAEAATPEKREQRTVLWESKRIRVGVIAEKGDHRFIIEEKDGSGSKIELDVTADNGNSVSLRLEARTAIEVYSPGAIDIRADGSLTLQGRTVDASRTGGI